jgi:cytochrome c-L
LWWDADVLERERMSKVTEYIGVAASMLFLAGAAAQTVNATEKQKVESEAIVFRHVLDDEPIEFEFRPDQTITPAVDQFHKTGVNAYDGDDRMIAAGKKLWDKLCVACHLKDGTGRIGPSLVDDEWKHPRVASDIGRFEILYAGGAGAMQAFGRRIDQDDILKVMAYLKELRGETN